MRTEAEVRRALEDAIENGDNAAIRRIMHEIVEDIVQRSLQEVRTELAAMVEKLLAERTQRQ